MSSPQRFVQRSRALAEGVRAHEGLIGLVLLGSAAEGASGRRDEWSDHDFFALVAPGRGAQVRPDLSWLPDQEALALTAREGEIGFVALYDDGHVFEFAFSDAAELAGALVGDATVAVDDEAGTVQALVARGQERVAELDVLDPANDARLVLVKLLIGVGRIRRGEVLGGGAFIRQWALQHLVRAIRGRYPDSSSAGRDTIDPLRRFEQDFPEWGARIAAAVAQEAEPAARALFAVLGELEPGWPEFPTRAATAVAARLGWGGEITRGEHGTSS